MLTPQDPSVSHETDGQQSALTWAEVAGLAGPDGQDIAGTYASTNDAWVDAVNKGDTDTQQHTGVMVAFYPDPAQAAALAVDGGEAPQDLHVTLVYLGQVGAELMPQDEDAVVRAVTSWAATQQPLDATTSGVGFFDQDPPVTYASIDAAGLPTARQKLVEALDDAGIRHAQEHGFTPHMTLTYDDLRSHTPPSTPMRFDAAHVVFAGNRTVVPLTGAAKASLVVNQAAPTTASMETSALPESGTRAFSVEINGKQLVAAPATVLAKALESAAMREPTLEEIAAQPMLTMSGRFVGADEANRNGAYWSSGDLQLATSTVAHGPLNWLHEGRHIIGSITNANYTDGAFESAAGGRKVQPHIAATASIWRWIYPDEAFVVQQASDLGQLWYSMECISSDITCTGPNGCGNTTSYSDYTAGAACQHVVQRASVRQFNNPVFLGGAVIVPPSRPGWADADARVPDMSQQVDRIAEAAYDQSFAGQAHPDMRASDWESLMAQLIQFATR